MLLLPQYRVQIRQDAHRCGSMHAIRPGKPKLACYLRFKSVLLSPQALQLRLVLAAVDEPHAAATAKGPILIEAVQDGSARLTAPAAEPRSGTAERASGSLDMQNRRDGE